jgi:hypothetical protein
MAQKTNTRRTAASDTDRNPDPITDAPGAHPVGVERTLPGDLDNDGR